MIYGESRKPWGNLSLELFGGYARTDDKDTQYSFLFQILPGSLEPNPSFVGRLNYEAYDGSLRFALSGAYTSMEYKSKYQLLEPTKGTISFNPIVLSAQYNAEKWTFTSEYSPNFFTRKGFDSPLVDNFNHFGQSYYFQFAYRISRQWEIMTRYDVMYPNSNDENGKKFQSETGFPAYTQFAKNWTVGIRYDITPWMMVRAEYDYVNGAAWLPAQGNNLDNPNINPFDIKQHWEIFGLQVSLRF